MADAAAVDRFYGRWARLYDVLAARTPGIASLRRRTADALGLRPGDTVVEMGCGTGANLPYLSARVGPTGRVVGVDLTGGMLARARARVERNGWANVSLLRADAARPPLEEADAVLASFVVGMLDEPGAAVEDWLGLLRPGGHLALLDAAPRARDGVLDAAFAGFVALSAPPTLQVRYAESPARRLGERVEAAHAALAAATEPTVDARLVRGFVRLGAGENHQQGPTDASGQT